MLENSGKELRVTVWQQDLHLIADIGNVLFNYIIIIIIITFSALLNCLQFVISLPSIFILMNL